MKIFYLCLEQRSGEYAQIASLTQFDLPLLEIHEANVCVHFHKTRYHSFKQ